VAQDSLGRVKIKLCFLFIFYYKLIDQSYKWIRAFKSTYSVIWYSLIRPKKKHHIKDQSDHVCILIIVDQWEVIK
jgi:hypothetical protein